MEMTMSDKDNERERKDDLVRLSEMHKTFLSSGKRIAPLLRIFKTSSKEEKSFVYLKVINAFSSFCQSRLNWMDFEVSAATEKKRQSS